MKYVLGVFLFFLLVSMGIGVYWFTRSKQTLSDAAFASGRLIKTLPDIVSDCDLFLTQECENGYTALTQSSHRSKIDTYLSRASNPALLSYAETHTAQEFPDLLAESLLPVKLSVADMIFRVSSHYGVSEEALLTVLQMHSPIFTQSNLSPSTIFTGEDSMLAFLQTAAQSLLRLRDTKGSNDIHMGPSHYQCEQDCSSASTLLYTYLSSQDKEPLSFEIHALKDYQNRPTNLYFIWRTIFKITL